MGNKVIRGKNEELDKVASSQGIIPRIFFFRADTGYLEIFRTDIEYLVYPYSVHIPGVHVDPGPGVR